MIDTNKDNSQIALNYFHEGVSRTWFTETQLRDALKLKELIDEELASLEGYVEYPDAVVRRALQKLVDDSKE